MNAKTNKQKIQLLCVYASQKECVEINRRETIKVVWTHKKDARRQNPEDDDEMAGGWEKKKRKTQRMLDGWSEKMHKSKGTH